MDGHRRIIKPDMDALSGRLSRRDLLKYAGLAAATVGSGSLIAACGDDTGSTTSAAGGTSGSTEKIKVAWAMGGPIDDGSWEATHAQGMKDVANAFPNVETSYVDQVPFGEQGRQTFEKLARDGNRMVFVTTDYGEDVISVAEANPDTIFMVVGGHQTSENMGAYYVANYSVAYVLGVAAGLLTETNKLGYVASFPVPNVFSDINGLQLGASSVNPDVSTQVVQIDTWYDPQKAAQAVNALVDDGADFIWHILGDTSVPQAAEKRGVWSAAWSLDARNVAPNGYVSTIALDWGPYVISQVQAVLDGNWEPVSFPPGHIIAVGEGVDRGDWGDKVPEDVRSQADAVRDEIAGGFDPFTGPLVDSSGEERVPAGESVSEAEFQTWDWSVQGIQGI